MRRLSLFGFAATVLTGSLHAAQLGPVDPSRIDTKHLTITLSTSTISVAAGKTVSLYVDVAPKPKMHVYAPDQTDYIPIALTIEPAPSFRLQPIHYPIAESFFFAPLNETQRVFSKPFRIVQPIIIGRGVPPSLLIKGAIRYQACDDAICYVPQTVPLTWKVAVKGAPR